MDNNHIVDLKNVDYSKLKLGNKRATKNGKTSFAIPSYNDPKADNQRFRIRLGGKLKAIFGVTKDEEIQKDGYERPPTVSLSFSDLGEEDVENGEILKFFKGFDSWIRGQAKLKSKEWFGKHEISEDVLDLQYKPMVQFSRDKVTKEILPYPPRINVLLDKKFGTTTGELELSGIRTKVGKQPAKEVHMDVSNCQDIISKFDDVLAIVEFKNVWFSSIGFGCKFRLYQARVLKKESSVGQVDLTGGQSDDEENEEEDEVQHPMPRVQSPDWEEAGHEDDNI